MLKIMFDTGAPASTRLRAADCVLSHAKDANKMEQMEDRVAALEQATKPAKQVLRKADAECATAHPHAGTVSLTPVPSKSAGAVSRETVMRSDLLRRIRRLEAHTTHHRWPVNLYYTCGKIGEEQRAALAPGERVVKDWCSCQSMFFVRERITTDPDDVGQRCGNPEDWPDEEGESPRSGESDGADDKQGCWHDRAREEERQNSMSSPEATATGPSPA